MSTNTVDTAHAAAVAVANAVKTGTGMRATMTDLDWAAVCGTSILAHVSHPTTDSKFYTLLGVHPLDQADIVAERALKPQVAETVRQDLNVEKHAGWAEATVEDLSYVKTCEWLIGGVVLRQIAMSVDRAIVAALDANNQIVDYDPAAMEPFGILLAAQAQLMANGVCPDTVAVSPSMYVEIISGMSASGFAQLGQAEIPTGGTGRLLGMSLVTSNAVADNTMYVFDSKDVVAAELSASPQLWLGAMSTSNIQQIVGDAFFACGVASPFGVVKVTATP
jgi:hypothetical protein